MKYGIEKAIAAAIEPLIDDIVALEKAVEQLRVALEKNARRRDHRRKFCALRNGSARRYARVRLRLAFDLSGFASFQSFSATPSVRAGSVMKVHAPQVA